MRIFCGDSEPAKNSKHACIILYICANPSSVTRFRNVGTERVRIRRGRVLRAQVLLYARLTIELMFKDLSRVYPEREARKAIRAACASRQFVRFTSLRTNKSQGPSLSLLRRLD